MPSDPSGREHLPRKPDHLELVGHDAGRGFHAAQPRCAFEHGEGLLRQAVGRWLRSGWGRFVRGGVKNHFGRGWAAKVAKLAKVFPTCSNFSGFSKFSRGSGRNRISDRPPIQVKRRVKSGELPAESSYATAAKLRANEVFVRCFDLHDWPGSLR